jgi:hypothetical protein
MPDQHWLSEQGRQRRDAILSLAIREAQNRRRKRIGMQAGGTVAVLLVIGATYLALSLHRPPQRAQPSHVPIAVGTRPATAPSPTVAPTPSILPAPESPQIVIERVQTDPALLRRLLVPPAAPQWTTLSDAELLDTLAAANQRAAIATIDGETVLVTY